MGSTTFSGAFEEMPQFFCADRERRERVRGWKAAPLFRQAFYGIAAL